MPCSTFFIPMDILVVTVLYIGFVLVTGYTVVPACLEGEPCTDEKMDNYTQSWMADFFLAGALLLFGLHLAWLNYYNRDNDDKDMDTETNNHSDSIKEESRPRKIRTTAVSAQLLMAGAYLQFGLAHWLFPDLETEDDGIGGRTGFWILSWFGYFFLTLSTMNIASFVESAREEHRGWPKPSCACCGTRLLRLFLGIVIIFSVLLLVGHFWCHIDSKNPVIQGEDENEDEDAMDLQALSSVTECMRLIEIAEIGWSVSYALFWVTTSLLLRGIAIRNPEKINGTPTPTAALLLLFLQSTIGFIYRDVWVVLAAAIMDQDAEDLFQQSRGAIVTHYGMLVTFYVLHNLSLSLTGRQKPKESALEQSNVAVELEESLDLGDKSDHTKMTQEVEKAEEGRQRDGTYFF